MYFVVIEKQKRSLLVKALQRCLENELFKIKTFPTIQARISWIFVVLEWSEQTLNIQKVYVEKMT